MKNITDDRGYSQVWADCYATRIRTERRCDMLISRMDSSSTGKKILEIGCGTGIKSFLLAKKTGMEVLGTDICAPFIEQAVATYALPNLKYQVLDFYQANSLQDGSFDYIVGDGILHHLYPRLDEALERMNRLLKKDGKIIFLEPNIRNPYVWAIFTIPFLRKATRLEPDEMAFSRGFISRACCRAGYRNINVEYRDFLLPYVPDWVVGFLIAAGKVVERIPLLRSWSQSIFLSADHQ